MNEQELRRVASRPARRLRWGGVMYPVGKQRKLGTRQLLPSQPNAQAVRSWCARAQSCRRRTQKSTSLGDKADATAEGSGLPAPGKFLGAMHGTDRPLSFGLRFANRPNAVRRLRGYPAGERRAATAVAGNSDHRTEEHEAIRREKAIDRRWSGPAVLCGVNDSCQSSHSRRTSLRLLGRRAQAQ
jgi:hypothetical protein